MQSEIIYYRGIKFRRYPESKRHSDKSYYCGRANGKEVTLHVYKYTCEVGPIPKGFHVHHKDENTLNNDIENLECIDGKKHMSQHMSTEKRKAQSRKVLNEIARPAAILWHKSEASTEWHKKHVYESLFATTIKAICEECGIEFETKAKRTGKNYFCCTKHQWRHTARVQRERVNQNIESKCPTCGESVTGQKYCSFECYTSRSI